MAKPKHAAQPLRPARGEGSSASVAERIDETARCIRELHRYSGLRFACEVGRLVLDRFFDGRLEQLRHRGPKDASLRKLARHPDLSLSASALYQAVGIFELLERHGGVHTCKHLGPSHLRPLIGLDEQTQARLLLRAERQRWTVEQVKRAAARAGRPRHKGGRPPLPTFVKTIHSLRRYVDRPEIYFAGANRAAELDDEERAELQRVVRAIRSRCDELDARLNADDEQ